MVIVSFVYKSVDIYCTLCSSHVSRQKCSHISRRRWPLRAACRRYLHSTAMMYYTDSLVTRQSPRQSSSSTARRTSVAYNSHRQNILDTHTHVPIYTYIYIYIIPYKSVYANRLMRRDSMRRDQIERIVSDRISARRCNRNKFAIFVSAHRSTNFETN